MPQAEGQLEPLRDDLAPKEEPSSAYLTRYVKRDVQLIACTTAEIDLVSSSNAKVTFWWSAATFLFGIFANGVTLADAPELSGANLFRFPYLVGLFGFLATAAAGFELWQKRSMLQQIKKETSTN
jgi:hypothetical protein